MSPQLPCGVNLLNDLSFGHFLSKKTAAEVVHPKFRIVRILGECMCIKFLTYTSHDDVNTVNYD